MNEQTTARMNRFGKVGRLLMTVLAVLYIILALALGGGAAYTASLPKDAVTLTLTRHTALKIRTECFPFVWKTLSDAFSYAAEKDPAPLLQDDGGQILPPEDTEIHTEAAFFDRSYASASIRSEGGEQIVEAVSFPAEYRSADLTALLALASLFLVSVAAAMLMLRRLFGVLAVCRSPFCTAFVSKLRAFGYSLLPVALLSSIGETLFLRFLSAGRETDIAVQWYILVTFAVTMCLVTVFRYGVQLQNESDETL